MTRLYALLRRLLARVDRALAHREPGPVLSGRNLRDCSLGELGWAASGYDDSGAPPLSDEERRALERTERGLRGRLDYRDGEW